MKFPHTEQEWEEAGERIAKELKLKIKPDGQFDMVSGGKTLKGLARTVHRLLIDRGF